MHKEYFSNKWQELKGKIKHKWSKLSENEISQINGSWDRLVSLIQKHYGQSKEHAEKDLQQWCESCKHEQGSCSSCEFWKQEEKPQHPSKPEKKRKAG